MLQSMSTIVTALVIAFIFGWKLALVVLGFMPFLVVTGLLQGRMIKGLSESNIHALEEGGRVTTCVAYYNL